MMPQNLLEIDEGELGQPKRVEFAAENPAGPPAWPCVAYSELAMCCEQTAS